MLRSCKKFSVHVLEQKGYTNLPAEENEFKDPNI